MALTPRERVQAVLDHRKPDRVPIILGTSNTTTLKMTAYKRLKAVLEIEAPDRYLYDWPELGSALPDENTLQRLGSDARGVHDRFPAEVYRHNRTRPPHAPCIDDWGIGQIEVEPGKWFPGLHPLDQATELGDIDVYPWPNMDDPSRIDHVAGIAHRLAQNNRYAIIGTPWLLFPFERACSLQGLDKFLLNMALNPDFAAALLERITSLCKQLMGHFLDALGDDVDIIKIGDDLGTQKNLLISPQMYREMLKPLHADYIAFIKERTSAKVFFHSDGDIFNLIDDLVEIGVDILNPIQTAAGKMADLRALKKRFGQELVFCGAIDTQHILPHGSPAQVRAEVRRVINTLGPGGGYMLAPVHTIMDEVPPENILAMVDAVQEFGCYALHSG